MEHQRPLYNKRPQTANSVYSLIREIHETSQLEDAANLLATNCWVMLAAAKGLNGVWLFALGRIQ